jgi:predicted RNA-binding protein YlqC (UPF0109 family)
VSVDDGVDTAGEMDDAEVDADVAGADDGPLVPTAATVLEYLTKALVADPDGVQVEVDDTEGITLNVTVADGDMGRVIGKRGRVANAIRVVGRAAAAKDDEAGVAIEFVD